MVSTIKYLPLLVASATMAGSFLFKVLSPNFDPLSLLRDIAVFFIVYYIVWKLAVNIDKMLKNYWKID